MSNDLVERLTRERDEAREAHRLASSMDIVERLCIALDASEHEARVIIEAGKLALAQYRAAVVKFNKTGCYERSPD